MDVSTLSRTLIRNLNGQANLAKALLRIATNRNTHRLAQYQQEALRFVASLRIDKHEVGLYRYTLAANEPLLYSSVFAALVYDLVDDLSRMSIGEKQSWIDYINSHQLQNGLFCDNLVANSIAELEDWWGWRHLTLLCLMALAALGGAPRYRLAWLDGLAEPSAIIQWLEGLDWDQRVDYTSNAVQNWIASMQFARDFMGEKHLGATIDTALDYLTMECSPETGLWGRQRPDNPRSLTRQIQAAYHFWLLYAYDSVEIPYPEKAIPYIIATQSLLGGYSPLRSFSSACEDIDSIDPLVRFGNRIAGRDLVNKSLRRALPWVLSNFNEDGGAVFRRDEEFLYGHPLMRSGINESSIFATWFRLLSIGVIDSFYSQPGITWRFLDAPGYQLDPGKLFHSPRFREMNAIPTHLTEQEKYYLFNIARNLPGNAEIVELGSYLGASTSFLAEGAQHRKNRIYCVDSWTNDAMSEGRRDTYQQFLTNTACYGDTVTPIRGLTVEVASVFAERVDLLFIDADHSYEAVTADLKSWLPKLRSGAWLLMHDWGWAEGVRRAIQEIVIPIQIDEPVSLPNLYAVHVDPRLGNYN